ncbi:MAG: TAXI family TRAP transporter solute-binding subunit [Gemmatimonadales bacterium]
MKTRVVAIGAVCALMASPAPAQQVVTLVSNPQGSQFFTVAAAVAKLMDQKMGLQARVQPMGGPTAYMPLLARGEAEFGLAASDDADTAYAGTEAYDGKPNPGLRLVAAMFPLPVSMAVAGDSPAKTLKDLKGLRLTAGYANQTTIRKVQDALLALMLNALDAMEQGGQLTVRTRRGLGREGEILIEVEDTGIGIPRADQGKIFEPFFTTKPPGRGTGLGLSICYGIVEQHRGRIEVESAPGKGSLFRVVLPANQDETSR